MSEFRSVWSELRETSFCQGWVMAGDVKTRYIQAGPADAPPLLMLHGTAGSWECFCANLPVLSREYNCYAFDLVGAGFSGKPDRDYEIPDYLSHVLGFMDAFKIPSASFIGCSLGAWIASQFASSHPERTQSLVLVSASGLITDKQTTAGIKGVRYKAVDDPTWANVNAVFDGIILDEHNRLGDFLSVRQAVYRQPGMRRAMEHILCLQEPAIRARNLMAEAQWRSIQAPALIFGAVDQEDIFLETAKIISGWMPRAEYLEIRGAAHWAQFESADIFNRETLRFLQSHRPS